MASTKTLPKKRDEPEWVGIQLTVRMPYWRREELARLARFQNVSIPTLINDALDRVYPPHPPS